MEKFGGKGGIVTFTPLWYSIHRQPSLRKKACRRSAEAFRGREQGGQHMRRSLRSWALQQFKWIKGGKRSFEERSEEGYAALLESYAESAAKDFANPERWTGMPVRESRIDGMQVFSWNDSGDPRQRVLI